MATRGLERRLELQNKLEDLLNNLGLLYTEPSGITNVYFQPGPNITLRYPCIVYNRINADMRHADNIAYRITERYSLTVITNDPDSEIPQRIMELPMCSYDRSFQSDDLNHDVFSIYW